MRHGPSRRRRDATGEPPFTGLRAARSVLRSGTMSFDPTQLIGWFASGVLLCTLLAQLRSQYRSKSTKGVSPTLYGGQILASVGFAVYAALIGNWVFIVTNSLLIGAAIGGLVMWMRFRHRETEGERAESPALDLREMKPLRPIGPTTEPR